VAEDAAFVEADDVETDAALCGALYFSFNEATNARARRRSARSTCFAESLTG